MIYSFFSTFIEEKRDGRNCEPWRFCLNEQCADYGKLQKDQETTNIIEFGKTKVGCQRYQCTSCRKTFIETKGTIFYRRRTAREAIIETLAQPNPAHFLA